MNAMIRVSPDRKRAESLIKSAEITLERINETNKEKYASNVAKDYYEIIRTLISANLILDGCKALGEEAHKEQINYFKERQAEEQSEISSADMQIVDEFRILRNRMSYEGALISSDFLKRKEARLCLIIEKLNRILVLKLGKS